MKIDGKCHCGNITFVAELDPGQVIICHCTDCQTLTGTPYRVVVRVPTDKIEWRGGKAKTYVKTAESGAKRVQAFCPECGTPIYSTSAASRRSTGSALARYASGPSCGRRNRYGAVPRSDGRWIYGLCHNWQSKDEG